MRLPARPNPGKRQVSKGQSIPAPVGGWDAVSALSDMKEDRAVVLDNWFPSTADVRVRRGHQPHCTGMGSGVVETLMIYNGLTEPSSAMFAVTGGNIYDASADGGAVITTETGLANNRWQYINFTTAGGKYLWCCNGADAPRHYNGSAWAEPVITGITASDIINVNGHKNRLWFVLRDSTKAAYLATGAVAGAATTFELGGLFTQGGYLVAMATWTRDGGAGPDDLAVFVSSRGQAAVYAGTDPASASTWELIGVYDVGPPIGYRCFTKVGAELMLVNLDGVLPLSKGLVLERSAQAQVTITLNINSAMNEAARSYKDNFGWEMTPYAKGTMAILNVPVQEGELQHQYVMNTITGAWCRFKGQNANCWAVYKDDLHFGGNDGKVNHADYTGIDFLTPIDAVGQGAYNYYNSPGVLKQWKMMQPLITTDSDSRPAVGISTDFKENASLGTPTASSVASAVYDGHTPAIYDVDVYAVEGRTVADWTSISGIGQCASIHFRARTGSITGVTLWGDDWGDDWSIAITGEVVMRLNGFNVIYEGGGFF
jgi:hypothetical protein